MRSWIARHPISFMALYTVFYLTAFHWLEVNITVPAIWVHCQLDDVIPFCKYAIVPYFAWFAWIPFTLFYLLRHGERSDFWRVCLCLFAGMTIALSCYLLLPTGLALRPYRVYGSDIFARLVRMLYAVDTARNVCPSIHVFNSVTLMIGYRRSRCFDEPGRRWMRPAANVLGAAIILSTMLLKQHSCIDVVLGAALAVNRYAASHPRLEQLNLELEKHSDKLRQRLIAHVEKRIQRAYPTIVQPEPTAQKEKALSFGDLVWLFVIGAFLGDVVETLFCRVTAGVWMSRSSLVWGPFSVVWGLALVMAAVLLRGSEERSDRSIFLFGFVMGGAYEYICSAVGELLFGVIFWDYSGFKFNLGGRVNLLYCFFWGIAAVVWIRYGYPLVAKLMANLKKHILPWMTVVLTVFMALNMGLSALALARYDARTSGIAPANQLDVFLDEHFDNARMERVYPNAKKTG